METPLITLGWILLIGLVVGLIVWLGPRPSQWRSHRDDSDDDDDDPPTV